VDEFYKRKVVFAMRCNIMEEVLREVLCEEHRFLVFFERFRI
jgi:hypothetical protein